MRVNVFDESILSSAFREAETGRAEWGDRAFDDAKCPDCGALPAAQHYVPCPRDRGVWPCAEWREQPGPGGAGTCECWATAEQHARWRGPVTLRSICPSVTEGASYRDALPCDEEQES